MGERGDPGGHEGDHVRAWADLHRTTVPTGFVGAWLRTAGAVGRRLAAAGVSPNALTVAALLAALAAVPLATVDGWIGPAAACLAVTVSGLLDALDGAVAVQARRATKVGFLLDSALDRLADAALPAALALAWGRPPAAQLAVAATGAAWWLEYVRARATLAAPDDPQSATPGERPTRIVLNAVGLGLPFLALAALWGQVVIVGGSALYLFASSVRRLSRHDRSGGGPGAATAGG